jgi:hypothetical protein
VPALSCGGVEDEHAATLASAALKMIWFVRLMTEHVRGVFMPAQWTAQIEKAHALNKTAESATWLGL